MVGVLFLKKIEYVKVKSEDGEIHFQECRVLACMDEKKYNADEAIMVAKKEAGKPLNLRKH